MCCAQQFTYVPLFATLWTVALPGPSVHGDSPGKNTGVGCHALLQGIFPTQELNPGIEPKSLPHRRQILYCLSHQGSPTICQFKYQQKNTKEDLNQRYSKYVDVLQSQELTPECKSTMPISPQFSSADNFFFLMVRIS